MLGHPEVEERRPPLADQLFLNRSAFRSATSLLPALHPIVPLLQRRQRDVSLEQQMQALAREAPEYPERLRQLMAVRYYLQYIFWANEDGWFREVAGFITNYRALLDQIDRWRKGDEPVCLVTFNYDRLIERALDLYGIPIGQMTDYVSSPRFKLFKLHGSYDWVRPVKADGLPPNHPGQQWPATHLVIANATGLKFSDEFFIAPGYPTAFREQSFVAPAIAIPVEDKTGFECPAGHLKVLEELLPRTDRMLVVGWRATENHFLQMLRAGLKGKFQVHIACGSGKEAAETGKRLTVAGIAGGYTFSEYGFTDLITRRELDSFLK
jgi:hypothetical protein